ncbi:phosphatidylinositol kinase [Parapedobacter pyrenivorans]|uniref:Phosphatidylinositol kinase n=1 Tax=Parapedobacter pyrenivorans TaxID=1305674 RepID=A0A917HTZ0_9SPHI|nr:HipA N-terminal domain-containing protein [Parapedobacter pyrenivorans]GGG90007.1 phosphatidylinositol kinase [Parapedobacter pyrenivorans]
MRRAKILFKEREAGLLTQHDDGTFMFQYHDFWVENAERPPISLTLPKRREPYESDFLFPFFYNMLPEGSNKQVICKLNQIDDDDYFGLLMVTAKHDAIGAVRVQKTDEI